MCCTRMNVRSSGAGASSATSWAGDGQSGDDTKADGCAMGADDPPLPQPDKARVAARRQAMRGVMGGVG